MTPEQPTRLARRLGTTDAVVIGLGSMIGAGVFAAIGPAARAAGNGLLLGLVIAAAVAYCNATSSAQLAALYPASGGTYVYGRERLGKFWGFIAGWGFVVGKLASCAAMATTFATYATPAFSRPVAAGAVLIVTALNYFGVQKTALATRVIVTLALCSLSVVVVGALAGGDPSTARLWPLVNTSPYGVLQSAGLLFFAFAGYARLATLGEEVVDPARTIPRAIPIALGIALFVYASVAVSALLVLDPRALGEASAPLAAALDAGRYRFAIPIVRIGAAIASLGVLLSLVVGISRTTFAMASNGDLPRFFDAVHPRYRVPHRAELAAGVIAAGLAAVADLRFAIGFSSFAVLLYYAIANASAFTLGPSERKWPRWLAGAGVVGCVVVACSLPWQSVAGGAGLFAVGTVVYATQRARAEGERSA
ncbi:MAG: APC family permease [Polyangiaceae bacterium]|nr:APC family permease [Polyangiaceae bacterium]